jgi:hypothetical protein
MSVLHVERVAQAQAQESEEAELRTLPPGDLRIRSRDCLVLHNLRLMDSHIRPYLEQGLDYEYLFQVGVLGLMRAARKFDPAKGYKFLTYATWWVNPGHISSGAEVPGRASAFLGLAPVVRKHLPRPGGLGDGPARQHLLEDGHESDDRSAVIGVQVGDVQVDLHFAGR